MPHVQDALEPHISKVSPLRALLTQGQVHCASSRLVRVLCACLLHGYCGQTLLQRALCCPRQDTLNVHWGKHHRTYVTNLNNQIKDKPLANKTLHEVTSQNSQLSVY